MIPQYEVVADGITYHPDLADPLRGIILEADSWSAHGRERRDHDRDCVRYNAFIGADWLVLRFTWDQVMHSPAYVIHTIRSTMAVRDAA